MWEEILQLAMNNGLWAVMFCSLFFYQLKDSKRREEKYNSIIDSLTDSLKIVNKIDEKLTRVDEGIQLVARSRSKTRENLNKVG